MDALINTWSAEAFKRIYETRDDCTVFMRL